MSERRKPIESKSVGEVIDEDAYIDRCVDYALEIGWVKPEQKDTLIDEYLRPIYQKYAELIKEVEAEIATESEADIKLEIIAMRLNDILNRTHRIGSTDFNNIISSIYDYRDRFCRSDTYVEYAATSLASFIADLLRSKS